MGFWNIFFSSLPKEKEESLVLEKLEKEILPFLDQDRKESFATLDILLKKFPRALASLLHKRMESWDFDFIVKVAHFFCKIKNNKKFEFFLENFQPKDKKDRAWIFLISLLLFPCEKKIEKTIQKKIHAILGTKTAQTLLEVIAGIEPETPSYITLMKGALGLPLIPVFRKLVQSSKPEIAQSTLLALAGLEEKKEEILPILMDALDAPDASVCKAAAIALSMVGESSVPYLQKTLKSKQTRLRTSSAWALGKMGKKAKNAAEDLIDAIEDKDKRVRNAALWALERIGPEICPVLIAKLQNHPKLSLLISGCDLLEKFSLDSPESHAFIMNLSNHDDKRLAQKAIYLLGKNKVVHSYSLLIKALEKEEELQKEALNALESLSTFIPEAIDPVVGILEKGSPVLRKAAANALFQIGGKEKKTQDAFLLALKDGEKSVKRASLRGLALFQEKAYIALPDILVLLESSKEKSLLLHCMETLAQIGEKAKDAIPLLEKWVLSQDDTLCAKSTRALGAIGVASIPVLFSKIDKASNNQLKEITKAFVKIGPSAIPYLVKAIKSQSPVFREVASDALGYLGESSLNALRKLMQEPDFWVKKAVLRAWQKNGKTAIPFLIDIIREQEDFNASVMAIEVLKKMKHKSLPSMICLLDDPQPQLSQLAVQSLRKVNQDYHQAIPDLLFLLKSPKPLIRQSVAWCLGEIGNKDSLVIQALDSLQQDPDPNVKQTAQETKEKLIQFDPLQNQRAKKKEQI